MHGDAVTSNTALQTSREVALDSAHQPEQQQPGNHAAKTEKAQLPILQRQQLLEHAPPAGGRQKRQQPFYHQHQGQRGPQTVAVFQDYFLAAGAAVLPLPRMALKKSDDGSNTITSLFLLKLDL